MDECTRVSNLWLREHRWRPRQRPAENDPHVLLPAVSFLIQRVNMVWIVNYFFARRRPCLARRRWRKNAFKGRWSTPRSASFGKWRTSSRPWSRFVFVFVFCFRLHLLIVVWGYVQRVCGFATSDFWRCFVATCTASVHIQVFA